LRALFEEPLPDELTDAELDEGDDATLSPLEELPGTIEIPEDVVESEGAPESE
jgi:hypothetical protein